MIDILTKLLPGKAVDKTALLAKIDELQARVKELELECEDLQCQLGNTAQERDEYQQLYENYECNCLDYYECPDCIVLGRQVDKLEEQIEELEAQIETLENERPDLAALREVYAAIEAQVKPDMAYIVALLPPYRWLVVDVARRRAIKEFESKAIACFYAQHLTKIMV